MTPSDNLLRRLSRVSPTVALLAALAMLMLGLFLPPIIGAFFLFLLGLALGALTFTTWPVQTPATRVFRVGMLVLLLAAMIGRIVQG